MNVVLLLVGWMIGLAIGVWIVTRPAFQRFVWRTADVGTVPSKPKPDAEPSALENGVRSAIAGHPRAAVRRLLLWVAAITAVGAGIALSGSQAAVVVLVIALVPLLLLALTDQLA